MSRAESTYTKLGVVSRDGIGPPTHGVSSQRSTAELPRLALATGVGPAISALTGQQLYRLSSQAGTLTGIRTQANGFAGRRDLRFTMRAGAQGGTRTLMPVKASPSEDGASTIPPLELVARMGFEPTVSQVTAGRSTVSLHSRGRGDRIRTCDLALPRRAL